jgi:hypothetical protein
MENSSAGTGCLTPDESSTSCTDGGKSLEAKKAPALPQIAADQYAKFERRLIGWEAFENAASSDEPHWFKDLLRLWRPSGHCSGAEGLRVAIRNGYLNFYRPANPSLAFIACQENSSLRCITNTYTNTYWMSRRLECLSRRIYV